MEFLPRGDEIFDLFPATPPEILEKGPPAVVDRIIDHLKLTFVAEKPPSEAVLQELLWVADPPAGFYADPAAALDITRGPNYPR